MNAFERFLLTLAIAAALALPGAAQIEEQRATFTGGGNRDQGKCTIEVRVDGSADVEIRGDRGLLRTRTGRRAEWRRFVCSQPMPANPGDFRFIGIDGRGRQDLVQDPRSGRGAAIVRIEDPKGGDEGYTFDLVWRGGDFRPNSNDRPMRGGERGGPRIDAIRACQDAAAQRIQRDGFRNVRFGSLNMDNRRNDSIAGTATAQRGNNGRAFDFEIRCLVDRNNGDIRSLQVNRR
jgi:hypothetical protein